MPKVKEKSLLREVEEEIARLSDDHGGGGGDSPDFPKSGIRDMMQLQKQQHTELMQAMCKSQQDTCLAMVSAMKDLVNTQQKQAPLALSSQQAPTNSQQSPALQNTIQAPHCSQQAQDPPVEEDYEDDDTTSFIDDDDFDFSGWDLPQSGQVAEITEPTVHKPGPSAAPDTTESPTVAATPVLNAELFNDYEDQPNWNPPVDLFYWLEDKRSKEVPPKTLKTISRFFTFSLCIYNYFCLYFH